jgi:AraC-like DNA-binding protein
MNTWDRRVLATAYAHHPNRDHSSGAYLWPAALFVWGPGAISASHSHHALQLVLALTGTLRVRAHPSSCWRTCGAVFVAAGAAHEVDARGRPVLIGFVDPQSDLAAPLRRRFGSDVVPIADSMVARWRDLLGDSSTLEPPRVDAWLRSEFLAEREPRRIHPAVQRVLRYLCQPELDRRSTSLANLARVAGLSSSRLMHVFTESLGIPLRPYLLWMRVQRAAGALASGRSVTSAAHLAGFADSSHLTRTFRQTLGTTPRELIRRLPATRDTRM